VTCINAAYGKVNTEQEEHEGNEEQEEGQLQLQVNEGIPVPLGASISERGGLFNYLQIGMRKPPSGGEVSKR
jgi:hypothetical protein